MMIITILLSVQCVWLRTVSLICARWWLGSAERKEDLCIQTVKWHEHISIFFLTAALVLFVFITWITHSLSSPCLSSSQSAYHDGSGIMHGVLWWQVAVWISLSQCFSGHQFAYHDSRWQFPIFFFAQYVPHTLTLLPFYFYISLSSPTYLLLLVHGFLMPLWNVFGCMWICVGHLPEHFSAIPLLNHATQWHILVQFSLYISNLFFESFTSCDLNGWIKTTVLIGGAIWKQHRCVVHKCELCCT